MIPAAQAIILAAWPLWLGLIVCAVVLWHGEP